MGRPPPQVPNPIQARRQTIGLAIGAAVLGGLALIAPIWPAGAVEPRVGLFLVLAAALEIFHGFRRSTDHGRHAAWVGGAITLLMGMLLFNAPFLAGTALLLFFGGWFALDATRHFVRAARAARHGRPVARKLIAAIWNLAVVIGILLLRERGVAWTVAIAGATRLFETAWKISDTPVYSEQDAGNTAIHDLGLPEHHALVALGSRLEADAATRAPIDRGWVISFLAVLFAIHLGRMGFDKSTYGILSPIVAVLGDVVFALAFAYLIVVPASLLIRRLTLPLDRKAWTWCLERPTAGKWITRFQSLVRWGLTRRLRFRIQLREARYSLTVAMSRGLQIGLPAAAIFAATIPVWGMSWYFDTENWASGIWNSWAESRTDIWREAMVLAVNDREKLAGHAAPTFAVKPPGVTNGTDFAFIVIGDTGEGDASQYVLRDSLIAAANQPDVRFVVISSDVIYPVGAMRDYEAKFWLPFMGVTKPVYAIPGNHDWYDALEAFVATFLDETSARSAMRARIEADHKITTTTDRGIDGLIREAARLRGEYRVPTGFQQAPFFQMQTDRFALIAVDTGVVKRVDDAELAWLRTALEASRGKFTLVVLGHPLYANGVYQAEPDSDFEKIHHLLRAYDVTIAMAGDTHDLEYYAEPHTVGAGASRTMHHFVNGGGGAYLSLGTALARPEKMATKHWAFYPATGPIVAKIERETPFWKRPAWWWTRNFNGWPFSAEWLSAAFDYNVAPFFQSFIEVRVEPSRNRVRLLPWGVHGRLTWADLATSEGLRPKGVAADAPVEWTFELAPIKN